LNRVQADLFMPMNQSFAPKSFQVSCRCELRVRVTNQVFLPSSGGAAFFSLPLLCPSRQRSFANSPIPSDPHRLFTVSLSGPNSHLSCFPEYHFIGLSPYCYAGHQFQGTFLQADVTIFFSFQPCRCSFIGFLALLSFRAVICAQPLPRILFFRFFFFGDLPEVRS